MRITALCVLLSLLAGCGLASTGAAGATAAAAAARDAAQGRQTEERMRHQLDAAARQAEQQRADAEKQNE